MEYSECLVCFSNKKDQIIKCVGCSLTVHANCYGSKIKQKRVSSWKCRYCFAISTHKIYSKNKNNNIILCRICNQHEFGALKPCASNNGFAHLVCALWTPFICIENEYNRSPIKYIEKCSQYKNILKKFVCSICNKNNATIKCRIKSCKSMYHPLCLIKSHRYCMIETQINQNNVRKKYYIYCPDHVQLHKEWDGKYVVNKREVTIKTIENTNEDSDNSDVIIVGDNINIANNKNNTNLTCTPIKKKKRKRRTFECESNGNDITVVSRSVNDNNNNNLLPPITIPLSPINNKTPSVNSSFMDTFSLCNPYELDISSQWTDRFQMNNDDINSITMDDLNDLRDLSPFNNGKDLISNNNINQTTVIHNTQDQVLDPGPDPLIQQDYTQLQYINHNQYNYPSIYNNKNDNNNNNNGQQLQSVSKQIKYPYVPQMQVEIPNLSNTRSLCTTSTNSIFSALTSPTSVSSLMTPKNYSNTPTATTTTTKSYARQYAT